MGSESFADCLAASRWRWAVEALASVLAQRGAEIIDGPDLREYGMGEVAVRYCNALVLAFGEHVTRAGR